MFTTEASFTVPISLSVMLFVISIGLYMHDVMQIRVSLYEASTLYEASDAVKVQNYLSDNMGSLYILKGGKLQVTELGNELEITYKVNYKLWDSMKHILNINASEGASFSVNAGKKKCLAESIRKQYFDS